MKFSGGTIEDFIKCIERKKIILFGCGAVCKTFVPFLDSVYNFSHRIICVVDNNLTKQGTYIDINGISIGVRGVEVFSNCEDDYCVLITNGDFYSVMKQLDEIDECRDKVCFIAAMMQLDRQYDRSINTVYKDFAMPQIPKIIHYCWFSGKPMPEILKQCVETWREYCPDYEFICWNESNYDLEKYRYTKEAYELEKWGYIPDIVRLDVLYEMGGFYFDTDVKFLKNLEDLRYQEAFCGRERAGHVNFGGGSGCIVHSKVIKEILEFRKDVPFQLKNGQFNAEASGYYETAPLMKKGLKIEDVNQKLDGINVYASEFFSPYNYINGENIKNDHTYSIHFFSGSWLEGGETLRKETRERYTTIKRELGDI